MKKKAFIIFFFLVLLVIGVLYFKGNFAIYQSPEDGKIPIGISHADVSGSHMIDTTSAYKWESNHYLSTINLNVLSGSNDYDVKMYASGNNINCLVVKKDMKKFDAAFEMMIEQSLFTNIGVSVVDDIYAPTNKADVCSLTTSATIINDKFAGYGEAKEIGVLINNDEDNILTPSCGGIIKSKINTASWKGVYYKFCINSMVAHGDSGSAVGHIQYLRYLPTFSCKIESDQSIGLEFFDGSEKSDVKFEDLKYYIDIEQFCYDPPYTAILTEDKEAGSLGSVKPYIQFLKNEPYVLTKTRNVGVFYVFKNQSVNCDGGVYIVNDNVCIDESKIEEQYDTKLNVKIAEIANLKTELANKEVLLQAKIDEINSLKVDVQQKAQLIKDYTSDINKQQQLIDSLNLDANDKAVLVDEVNKLNSETPGFNYIYFGICIAIIFFIVLMSWGRR